MSDISLLQSFYTTVIRQENDPPFAELSEERKQNLEVCTAFIAWRNLHKRRTDNLLKVNATVQCNLGKDSHPKEKEDAKSIWRFILDRIRTYDPQLADRMSDEEAEPFEYTEPIIGNPVSEGRNIETD